MTPSDRLDRGQQAYAEGEFRAAVIDAKNVLQEEPDNAAARLLLGRAAVRTNDPQTAEIELRRAVELGVAREDVLVDLGNALLEQNKFTEVIAELEKDAAAGDDQALKKIRADARLGLGEPDIARAIYTDILAAEPANRDAALGVVRSYVLEGNPLQARQTIDILLESDPGFIDGLTASGGLALQSRQFERAISDLGEASRLARDAADRPAEIRALSGLADAYFASRDIDAARDIGQRMTDIAPPENPTTEP